MVTEPSTSEIPSLHAGGSRPQVARRVLLVTSAAPAQSPFATKEKRPPLGIGFLIAVLRAAGHEVFFLDNYLRPNDFLETDYLREQAIDFVGIYANTICFRDTLRMLYKLHDLRRTQRWQGRILVGGPHAAVAPQTIPAWVDYVVQGEGEQAILDIVAGKVNERMVRYPRLENLDTLPRPAWDCFVGLPYNWDTCFLDETPVFTMNTSRGCPFQCTFCSVGSVWGKRYTYFSADRIVSDIEHLVQNYGAKGIYFREDNFTLHEGRLRRFCELMIEKKMGIPWVCESRVSTLTRERVALMAQAGARGLYFGVESGSPRMLELLGKGITIEQTENAFRWCRECGIKTAASVVVGVPGETSADLAATRDLLQRIQPTITWPNVFVGIPDSRLYRSVLQGNAYEYIDDRGLVYLPGHNEKVRQYYGGSWNAGIPDTEAAKDETNRPKVSVLLCVHNGERFVRAALASIYAQTYQNFEVVLVDDGSTDGTPEILREMKDSRTVIYRNAQRQGLTKSLNTGLRLCRGEYVARMDADDLSHPHRFEKQVQFLDSNPDCCVVGSWCHWIDAEGQATGSWEPPTEAEAVRHRLLVRNCVAHGSVMVRRTVLEQAGGYDETYPYAQDYDLWLRLSEAGQVRNLSEHLHSVRRWEGAISQSKSERQRQCADAALLAAQRRQQPRAAAAADPAIPSSVRVSVVLTTYNRPEFLGKVLEGFARQTAARGDFEVIVVDDGSVPPVREIAAPSAGRMRLKYLRQDNAGLAAARNAGIRAAEGDIVLFSDDDDVPAPELIAEHLRSHREYPDEKVVVLGHLDWHPDLTVTPLMHYVTHVGGEYFGFDRLQDGQFYDRWKWWGGLVSAKRSLLQSLEGPFDTRLRFGYEDTELVCRLADRQIRVLYNAQARSYVLKPVTFEEFCRRSYKQGKALHRVAAAHPETIVPRYRLEYAADEYRGTYAGHLEEWAQKIAKFETLLTENGRTARSGADQHLQMLYAAYRECFRGHVLKGYVEQLEAVKRGEVSLGDPVNDEGSAFAQESALTLQSARAQSAARRHKVQRDRAASEAAPAAAVRPLRIAFVDTSTPCFDVGSSSLRVHHIVKILVAQGHRIDYLYMGRQQGDRKYKAAYDGAVQFVKVVPTVNSFCDYLRFNGRDDLDVVWITNLWALDYTSFALQLTRWLRANRPQIRVIIDTMDLHYKKFLRRFELSGRPQERETAERFLELERQLYLLADRVLAVTEVEKSDILAHVGACPVEVIPNVHPVGPQNPDLCQRRHICFLGAFRIGHNLDAIQWFLQAVYPLIVRQAPDVQFHILGHGNEAFRETFKAFTNIKVVGYVEDAEQAVGQYRLFVCPMIYGAGMKGKLGTAAAAGTPFVTTTIGAEGFDFVDGRHCFIADRPEAFAARCLDLLRDDTLWERFRVNAADLVRSRFSIAAAGQRLAGLLQSLDVQRCVAGTAHESVAAQTEHGTSANLTVAPRPKVSIIIVCHNGERYLGECLDSIRSQTLREWELLLLDDGSTDGTRRMVEEHARSDPRIKSFHFSDEAGPYVRRNFALERAAAQFIVVQEADDIMSPHKLAVLYRTMARDSQLAAVGSWYRDFLHEFQGLQYTECQELPLEHDEIIERLAVWRPGMSHASAIVRKEMFRTLGPYDANPLGSDAFWLAKLAQYVRCRPDVRVRNVPEYLTLRRVRTGSETAVLSTIDSRSRRARYQNYCEVKLRKIHEKIHAEPGTDVAAELRNCDCSDFLVRCKAHIIRWESEPPGENVIPELLRHSARLFDETLYVTCVSVLAGVERMQSDIAERCRNYDLLRALAFFALAMRDQSRQYVEREVQNHDNPAARQFLADCLECRTPRDVQNWCAENGGCTLQLVAAGDRVPVLP